MILLNFLCFLAIGIVLDTIEEQTQTIMLETAYMQEQVEVRGMNTKIISIGNIRLTTINTMNQLEVKEELKLSASEQFFTAFIEHIYKHQFAELKPSEVEFEINSELKEIDLLVKSKHLFQVMYWVKKHNLVAKCETKRKSYITSLIIELNEGENLKINLI